MTKVDIQVLIARYNAGQATENELAMIERMIEAGQIDMDQLNDLKANLAKIDKLVQPELSDRADAKFYDHLAEQMRKQTGGIAWSSLAGLWESINQPRLQWAYSVAMLLLGSFIGYYVLHSMVKGDQIDQLTAEMADMKQIVLLTMLEKESSTDRLRAVSLYADLDNVSDTVAMALIKSLRNDSNVNVRLASIEALARYTDNPKVRQALIESISYQNSPLVQLGLAELMVAMQEKKAVEEFDKIIERQETPEEIKKELAERMNTLI
jgi:hypothetical protein